MINHSEKFGKLVIEIIENKESFIGHIYTTDRYGLRVYLFDTKLSDFNNTLETLDYHVNLIKSFGNGYVVFSHKDGYYNYNLFNTIKEAKKQTRLYRDNIDDYVVVMPLKNITKETSKDYNIYCYSEKTHYCLGIFNMDGVFDEM